jgi:hypothetical protein
MLVKGLHLLANMLLVWEVELKAASKTTLLILVNCSIVQLT